MTKEYLHPNRIDFGFAGGEQGERHLPHRVDNRGARIIGFQGWQSTLMICDSELTNQALAICAINDSFMTEQTLIMMASLHFAHGINDPHTRD
jgi:hypothetical protein